MDRERGACVCVRVCACSWLPVFILLFILMEIRDKLGGRDERARTQMQC